jgi:hypothetical protein
VLTQSSDPTRGYYSRGLRTARYLYVEHEAPGAAAGEVELYDLAADPLQHESRHDDPGYAAIRGLLADTLEQLRDCQGAACRAPLPEALR